MIQLEDLKIETDYCAVLFNSEFGVSLLPLQEIREVEQISQRLDCIFDALGQSSSFENRAQRQQQSLGNDLHSATEEQQGEQHRQRGSCKLKNQTKNIPKNFGKGIISFIERSEERLRPLLSSYGLDFNSFVYDLKQQKRRINTIADLRRLWTEPKIGSCLRAISNVFFRKHALAYIFNSRIRSYGTHIKYRQTMWQALRTPHSFNHIKQF